jgi:MULE transposase domain
MTRKTTRAYEDILGYVKELCPGLNPKVVITDFEMAMRSALRYYFPSVKLIGCHFHFSKVIYHHTYNNYLF